MNLGVPRPRFPRAGRVLRGFRPVSYAGVKPIFYSLKNDVFLP